MSDRARRTRQDLLEAARGILIDEGIERLSMDRVAQRAGVSKGAVMYHFATKRALQSALIDDYVAHMEESYARHEAKFEGAPEAVLAAAYVEWFRCFCEDRQGWATVGVQLLSQQAADPELLEPLRAWYARLFERIETLPPACRTQLLLVVMALEGLFYARKFGFDVLTPERRASLLELIAETGANVNVVRRGATEQ